MVVAESWVLRSIIGPEFYLCNTNIISLKKLFTLFSVLFFAPGVYSQASEMVERSWEIFGDDMDSAKILCTKGYYLAVEKGDMKTMGRAMAYRAIYYDIEAKTDSALFLFYKALDIQETIHDTAGLVTTYNNLGIFHFSQYQYQMALGYYQKAYDVAMLLNDHASAAGSLVNMGIIESYKPGGGKAANYYSEAERLYLLDGDSISLLPVWSNTAKLYLDKKEYEKAYEYNLKSIQFPDDNKSLTDWITERVLMTNILTPMGRFDEAEKYALQGLMEAEKNKVPERKQYLYDALSQLYFRKGDYEKAFTFSSKYRDLRDSLINESKAQQIATIESAYHVEKTNNENTKLKLDAEQLKNKQLREEKIQLRLYSILIAAGIGLVILVIVVLLLVNNLRLEKVNSQLLTDKKKHTEALLEKEKLLMREAHHRIKNNLQFINGILYLQSKNMKDPSVEKALLESRKRIQSISFAHQQLYGNSSVEKLSLENFLKELVASIRESSLATDSKIDIELHMDEINVGTDVAIPIGLIVNELLTNSLKYAFSNDENGKVIITIRKVSNTLELTIEDNGRGMAENSSNNGFGHQLVKSMAKQLKAAYHSTSKEGLKHFFSIPVSFT